MNTIVNLFLVFMTNFLTRKSVKACASDIFVQLHIRTCDQLVTNLVNLLTMCLDINKFLNSAMPRANEGRYSTDTFFLGLPTTETHTHHHNWDVRRLLHIRDSIAKDEKNKNQK